MHGCQLPIAIPSKVTVLTWGVRLRQRKTPPPGSGRPPSRPMFVFVVVGGLFAYHTREAPVQQRTPLKPPFNPSPFPQMPKWYPIFLRTPPLPDGPHSIHFLAKWATSSPPSQQAHLQKAHLLCCEAHLEPTPCAQAQQFGPIDNRTAVWMYASLHKHGPVQPPQARLTVVVLTAVFVVESARRRGCHLQFDTNPADANNLNQQKQGTQKDMALGTKDTIRYPSSLYGTPLSRPAPLIPLVSRCFPGSGIQHADGVLPGPLSREPGGAGAMQRV